jgi:predicted HicB family RNase H-like nuclease
MQTAPFVEALRREVAAAVASDDHATAAAVERLAASLEAAAHLWLFDAAGQAADQLNGQLPEGHVEVRLAGRDPELVYVAEPTPEPAPSGDDYAARITLRLPEALKAKVEQQAAVEGVSVNTWLVRTIARGQQSPRRTPGRRLSGYGTS